MIAGDHHRRDARGLAVRHCRWRLVTRRVHEGHETEQDQFRFQHCRADLVGQGWQFATGDGQDTITLGGEALGFGEVLRSVQGLRAAAGEQRLAAGHDRFGSALHEGDEVIPLPMDGAHALAFGIERHFSGARQLPRQCRLVESRLTRGQVQRHLGWIAQWRTWRFVRAHIVVQRQRLAQPSGQRIVPLPEGRDRDAPALQQQGLQGHAIPGQGAGLVGADVGHRSQGLHRRQPSHQRVAPAQPARTERERYGHDGWERLGNRSDGQADGGEQHQQQRLALQQPDAEDDGADRQYRQREVAAEAGQALL